MSGIMLASVFVVIPDKPIAKFFSFYLLKKIADLSDLTNGADADVNMP
jgi:hypothetical protein